MYGFLLKCIESFVIAQYGKDVWVDIFHDTTLRDDATTNSNHVLVTRTFSGRDKFFDVLASLAENVANFNINEFLEEIGYNFIDFFRENGYEDYLRCQGRTLREWLGNFNELCIHISALSDYSEAQQPGQQLPQIYCTDDCSSSSACKQEKHAEAKGEAKGEASDDEQTPRQDPEEEKVASSSLQTNVTSFLVYFRRDMPSSSSSSGSGSSKGARADLSPLVIGMVRAAAKTFFKNSEISLSDEMDGGIVGDDGEDLFTVWKLKLTQTQRLVEGGRAAAAAGRKGSSLSVPLLSSTKRKTSADDGEVQQQQQQLLKPSTKPSEQHVSTTETMEEEDSGLSGTQLAQVFPYHIAIDSDFKVTQAGSKLKARFPHDIVGMHIGDLFTVKSSCCCYSWKWSHLMLLKDTIVELQCERKEIMSFSLHGGLLLSSSSSADSSSSSEGNESSSLENVVCPRRAFFLVHPHVESLKDMVKHDLTWADTNRFSPQQSLIMLAEKLRAEMSKTVKSQQEAALAKHSLEMKRMFVRYVSHEIRTPLNTVSMGLELIQSLRPSNDPVDDPLGIFSMAGEIQESCGIAVGILNDLLLYEKLEGGILSLSKKCEPALQSVFDSVRVFDLQARAADVDLQFTFNTSCFSPTEMALPTFFVDVDRPKLGQVLRNLVSNAVKFTVAAAREQSSTRKGGQEGDVEGGRGGGGGGGNRDDAQKSVYVNVSLVNEEMLESERIGSSEDGTPSAKRSLNSRFSSPNLALAAASRAGRKSSTPRARLPLKGEREQHVLPPPRQFLRVEIIDQGPGISESNQLLLFNQIIQFDPNTLQGGGGSGLGLYISKGIMDLHGGSIGVYSEGEGKGSMFWIDLPVHHAKEPCSWNPGNPLPQEIVAGNNKASSLPRKKSDGVALAPSCDATVTTKLGGAEDKTDFCSPADKPTADTDDPHRPSSSGGTYIPPALEHENKEHQQDDDHAAAATVVVSKRGSVDERNESKSTRKNQRPSNTISGSTSTSSRYGGGGGNRGGSYHRIGGGGGGAQTTPNDSSAEGTPQHSSKAVAAARKAPPPNRNDTLLSPKLLVPLSGGGGPYKSDGPSSCNLVGQNSGHVTTNSNNSNPSGVALARLAASYSSHCGSEDAAENRSLPPAFAEIVPSLFRVLVVDDSMANRRMTSRFLTLAKLCDSADEAKDGAEAVAKVKSSLFNKGALPYDAILMDFVMPVMDGPTAARAIRDLGYKGIIVGVTGNVLPEDTELFTSQGANVVMGKPLDTKQLKYLLMKSIVEKHPELPSISTCLSSHSHTPVRGSRAAAGAVAGGVVVVKDRQPSKVGSDCNSLRSFAGGADDGGFLAVQGSSSSCRASLRFALPPPLPAAASNPSSIHIGGGGSASWRSPPSSMEVVHQKFPCTFCGKLNNVQFRHQRKGGGAGGPPAGEIRSPSSKGDSSVFVQADSHHMLDSSRSSLRSPTLASSVQFGVVSPDAVVGGDNSAIHLSRHSPRPDHNGHLTAVEIMPPTSSLVPVRRGENGDLVVFPRGSITGTSGTGHPKGVADVWHPPAALPRGSLTMGSVHPAYPPAAAAATHTPRSDAQQQQQSLDDVCRESLLQRVFQRTIGSRLTNNHSSEKRNNQSRIRPAPTTAIATAAAVTAGGPTADGRAIPTSSGANLNIALRPNGNGNSRGNGNSAAVSQHGIMSSLSQLLPSTAGKANFSILGGGGGGNPISAGGTGTGTGVRPTSSGASSQQTDGRGDNNWILGRFFV